MPNNKKEKEKIRLDQLVFEKGLASSRTLARAYILEGKISVDGQKICKPGNLVSRKAVLAMVGEKRRFVSRGGEKLEKALDYFNIDPGGRVVLDVGASTGGFTDLLLKRGAKKVYALDVGYGQLAYKLRCDPRVVVMERCNIRYLSPSDLDTRPSLVVVDVSFISVLKFTDVLFNVADTQADYIILIKPQFECGREEVSRGGIVRNKEAHISMLENFTVCLKKAGLFCHGLTSSPITGADGNIEYLLHGTKESGNCRYEEHFKNRCADCIRNVVQEASLKFCS